LPINLANLLLFYAVNYDNDDKKKYDI